MIFRSLFHSLEGIVIFATEVGKGMVHEGFRVGVQVANSISAAVIEVVTDHKSYYAARRNRIHPGPEMAWAPPTRPCSSFAGLFANQAPADPEGLGPSMDALRAKSATPDRPLPLPRTNSRSRLNEFDISDTASCMTEHPRRVIRAVLGTFRWMLGRFKSSLRLCLLWIPGMGVRAERLAMKLDREGPAPKAIDLDYDNTGLLEDIQVPHALRFLQGSDPFSLIRPHAVLSRWASFSPSSGAAGRRAAFCNTPCLAVPSSRLSSKNDPTERR